MALSGTITSSMTAREIVTTALELTGHCSPGDTPEADHAALGLKHLNWLLKTWQTTGVCDLWRVEGVTATTTPDVATITLATNYLDINNVRYRNASGIDLVLRQLSREEYEKLPNKASEGTPVSYMAQKGLNIQTLYLWPVATTAVDIVFDVARVVNDVTNLAQDVDVPQEWTECLWYSLAARIAMPLKLDITAPARFAKIEERAASLYATLKSFDEETGSVFLGVSEYL